MLCRLYILLLYVAAQEHTDYGGERRPVYRNGMSTLVTHQPYTEMDLNTCRPEQRSGLVAIYYSALCDVVPEQRQALLFWCATEENGIPGNS